MATLIKITTNSIDTEFKQLNIDAAATRYFLDFTPSGPEFDNGEFHGPGWNGNAVIRRGFTGQKIVLNVRYQDTLSNANAAWKTDRSLFAQYNNSIFDGVTTWARCTMISSERTSEEMAQGPGGVKFFSVRYVFRVQEQY